MADDWDLYAVVRSCKSSVTASSPSPSSSSSMESGKTTSLEEGNCSSTLSCLASLTFEEENDPFSFPQLGHHEPRVDNAFQELQSFFYKPPCFFPTTTAAAAATSHHAVIPNSSISDLGGSSGRHHHHQQQLYHHIGHRHHLGVVPHKQLPQLQQHFGPKNGVVFPAQFPPQSAGFGANFHVDQQRQPKVLQQQVQPGFHAPDGAFVPTATTLPLQMPLPNLNPAAQNPRSRKRKNQLTKLVRELSKEDLNSDLWAWRKYGQKPIKGSPYPRNYYRCSSSKGCAARKQVERSNLDPELFIVTYTGEHAHPRPAQRNSLAGSTRAKTTTAATTAAEVAKPPSARNDSPNPAAAPANSCSSPQSGRSLSPTTPLSAAQIADEEAEAAKPEDGEKKLGDGDGDDEENILIPNNSMRLSDEYFFYGVQQLGYSPPGAAC